MQSYFFQILLALKSIIVFGSALLNYGDFSTFGFKIIMSSPKALGQGQVRLHTDFELPHFASILLHLCEQGKNFENKLRIENANNNKVQASYLTDAR